MSVDESFDTGQWGNPLLVSLASMLHVDHAEISDLAAAGVPSRQIVQFYDLAAAAKWLDGCAALAARSVLYEEVAAALGLFGPTLHALLSVLHASLPQENEEFLAEATERLAIGHYLCQMQVSFPVLVGITRLEVVPSFHLPRLQKYLPPYVEGMEKLNHVAQIALR